MKCRQKSRKTVAKLKCLKCVKQTILSFDKRRFFINIVDSIGMKNHIF